MLSNSIIFFLEIIKKKSLDKFEVLKLGIMFELAIFCLTCALTLSDPIQQGKICWPLLPLAR